MSALALAAAARPAAAQSWNMYNSYTDTVTLDFVRTIPNPVAANQTPTLTVSVGGGPAFNVTMDTGSTGMAMWSGYVNTTGLQPLGPGQITYTSSGNLVTGTYYNLPVTISGANGGSATAMVKVLVTDQKGTAMMGVGFDRGGASDAIPQYPTTAHNAFLNIFEINGKPVTNMRTGYVVSSTGVTLGLTAAQSSGFAMLKLTPNTIVPSNIWNRANMGVKVGTRPERFGSFLPDSGIAYMILTPQNAGPSDNPPANCPSADLCVNSGQSIVVNLTPGLPDGAKSSYTFTTGHHHSGMAPLYVNLRDSDGTPTSTTNFVNSGNAFFLGIDYLFDFDGGYVGYASNGSNYAAIVPLLSLAGPVPLPNGFASMLPTFLVDATTLSPAGSASFNTTFMGLGHTLTINGPGSVNFNGMVDMGGALDIQRGYAVVNAGFAASSVNVGRQGWLAGSGTVYSSVSNGGNVAPGSAPGNSIGTLNIVGSYSQTAGGTYQAEFNAAGNQSDLVNVTGAATLGGTVSVAALPSATLMPPTAYRILSATGGISGAFAVSDPYPFLQTSLSYDPNNVYLNVQFGFAQAATTQTQQAVGAVLDANLGSASGDFATVLASMAYNTLSSSLAQATLTSLSGNNYAGLSSSMVQGAMLFMNNFTGQTGSAAPGSSRVALAEVCDVACDATAAPTWGAWGGGLGGLGTIGAGQAIGGVTYNVGGFAAGLDRLVAPGLRVGVTTGYTTGTQWVSGFSGRSTSDTVQAGLYGNFVQDKVYADAIVGYAYSSNQMWRQISIPGLQPRTALGQTGANQFYGQIETGYRFDLGGTAQAFVTPFARLQAYTGTQNGFTETGAQSLNLTVAQQTTNSLRTVLGAQLGGAMDLGWREKLAVQFRLGWSHEYADTARPVTATFAGAPASPFTTFGVAPTRDGVVLGLAANTAVADTTSLYLRYEGDISGQDSAHAITAGLRMTW